MTLIETIERYKLTVAVRTDTPEKVYKAATAFYKIHAERRRYP